MIRASSLARRFGLLMLLATLLVPFSTASLVAQDTDGPPLGFVDGDGDYIPDDRDNCPDTPNRTQLDMDRDGLGDACDATNDTDRDEDYVPNDRDNCPDVVNTRQLDGDRDGLGDACDVTNDADFDEDSIPNDRDNCPDVANTNQLDGDRDGLGDACDAVNDADIDEDLIPDDRDNCPDIANTTQLDVDRDGLGDACDATNDTDFDEDLIPNDRDNCPDVANTKQLDADRDGLGDACDDTPTGDSTFLVVTTTPDGTEIEPGAPLAFEVTVSNAGSDDAIDVALTETLPSGIDWAVNSNDFDDCLVSGVNLTCTDDLLPVGGSRTVTVSGTLPEEVTSCQLDLGTTATAEADNAAQVTDAGSYTVVCEPDVTISKDAVADDVTAGGEIGFTITVTNTGPGAASDVAFSDDLPDTGGDWAITSPVTLPDGVECPITDGSLDCTGIVLEAGTGTFSVTVSSTLPADPADDVCDGISNIATLSVPYAGESTASVAVDCPNVTITKAAVNAEIPAGDLVGFTITVANSGDADATDVGFTDDLPLVDGQTWAITAPVPIPDDVNCQITDGTLDCTGIDLEAATGAFNVTVTSDTATDGSTCGTYENTATLTNYGEASSETASVSVTCAPDVTISKTATADEVNAGEDIGFIITVANEGSAEATDVGFTDTLPVVEGQIWAIIAPAPIPDGVDCQVTDGTLTCSGIDLDAATGTFSVTVSSTIPPVPAADVCDGISNTATLSTPYDGESTASVTVACPNVTITKTAVDDEVTAGEDIGFTITVTNTGSGAATGVGFTDSLPVVAEQTWAISDPLTLPDDVDCAITDGTLDCSGIDLDPLNGAFAITVTSATTAASDTTSCDTTQTYDNSVALSDPYDGDASASVDVNPCSPEVRCEQTAIAAQIDPASYNVVVGTSGNDDFTTRATAGQDLYCGFGGADSVDGLPDGDVFFGGVDNDLVGTVNGGQFIAGDGDDTVTNLLAGEAVGIFKGEGGNDHVATLQGGAFNGADGNDTVTNHYSGTFFGLDGEDVVDYMNGTGNFNGGLGEDTVIYLTTGNFSGSNDNDLVGTLKGGVFKGSTGNDRVNTQNGGVFDASRNDDSVDILNDGVFNGDDGNDTVDTQKGGVFNGNGDNDIVGTQYGGKFYGDVGDDTVTTLNAVLNSFGDSSYNGGAGVDHVETLTSGHFDGGPGNDTVTTLNAFNDTEIQPNFTGGIGDDHVETQTSGNFMGYIGNDSVKRLEGGTFNGEQEVDSVETLTVQGEFYGGGGDDHVDTMIDGGVFYGMGDDDIVTTIDGSSFWGGGGNDFISEFKDGFFVGWHGDPTDYHGEPDNDHVGTMYGGAFRGRYGHDYVDHMLGGQFNGFDGADYVTTMDGGYFFGSWGGDHVVTMNDGEFDGHNGDDYVETMNGGTFNGEIGNDYVITYHDGTFNQEFGLMIGELARSNEIPTSVASRMAMTRQVNDVPSVTTPLRAAKMPA